MTDLHEKNDPEYGAQIDTVGWIFGASLRRWLITAAARRPRIPPYRTSQDRPVRESLLAQQLWQLGNGSPRSFAPHRG